MNIIYDFQSLNQEGDNEDDCADGGFFKIY